MFGIKSGKAQALRWSYIFADTHSLVEESIDKLCDRPTHLNQLEGRQLQLHSCHCWLAPKNSLLQAGNDYH